MRKAENHRDTSPESAELFHLIVENVKDYAIFMTDVAGVVVSWNPGVERLLGYAESEIVGQPVNIIFAPEDQGEGAHIREMEIAQLEGRSDNKRWCKHKDGSRFWSNEMLIALKNDDGTLRGFAKIMRDDTAQKLAEEKLEQTKLQHEELLASINDSFYRLDGEFRYRYVNEATTKMFGLAEADFLVKRCGSCSPMSKAVIFTTKRNALSMNR